MPKIMIDAGHYGKYNRSPAVSEYYESIMAWDLHLKLKTELEKYGFIVATTRPTRARDLEVYARGAMARGYDMFISLHSNAVGSDVRNDVDRPVVIRLADDIEGDKLARNITNMIAEVMQTKQDGTVSTRVQNNGAEYYGVLRGAKHAGCPHAYIIEHSFHTATAPAKWLLVDSNLDILAKLEAKLIAEFYSINKTEEDEPMTAEEKAYVKKLEERISGLEKAKEKVYHYWKELPSWALRPLWAMHKAGLFSGESVGDLNASRSLVRTLVSNAAAFRKLGVITYSDGKSGETKDDILRELGIIK